MIIAIQAALMCQDVEYDEVGRPSYLTVVGGGLSSPTRPGLEPIHIVLHLATDRQPGSATITVSAGDWTEPFAFTYGGGMDLTGAHLVLAIPILEPGELSVVVDNGVGRKFAVLWRLTFSRNAEPMTDPDAAAKMLAGAREAAKMMREDLVDRVH